MKKMLLALAVVALLCGAQSAMAVTISYSTLGCFYVGAGTCVPAATDSEGPGGQLVYTGDSATVNTVGSPSGSASAFLGNFRLTNFTDYDYAANDVNFLLRIIVTNPAPGDTDDFVADVTGAVSSTTLDSGVNVVFPNVLSHGSGNPPTLLYTATDGTTVGIHIESQTVPRETHPAFGNQPANIQGHFHTQEVVGEIPEPTTMALMGSGLFLVGLFARRFQK